MKANCFSQYDNQSEHLNSVVDLEQFKSLPRKTSRRIRKRKSKIFNLENILIKKCKKIKKNCKKGSSPCILKILKTEKFQKQKVSKTKDLFTQKPIIISKNLKINLNLELKNIKKRMDLKKNKTKKISAQIQKLHHFKKSKLVKSSNFDFEVYQNDFFGEEKKKKDLLKMKKKKVRKKRKKKYLVCKCKTISCLKNYCKCRKNGGLCNHTCKCLNCGNF